MGGNQHEEERRATALDLDDEERVLGLERVELLRSIARSSATRTTDAWAMVTQLSSSVSDWPVGRQWSTS